MSMRDSSNVLTWERYDVKKGRLLGWTVEARRNFRDFMLSVVHEEMDYKDALVVTLTTRHAPVTSGEATKRLRAVLQRLRRGGLVRWLLIVEFNRQRVPHYHGIVFGVSQYDVWRAWSGVQGDLGVRLAAQQIEYCDDEKRWFGYLMSHLGKGGLRSSEGQRSAAQAPLSWIVDGSLGRMWRKGGDWPVMETSKVDVHPVDLFRARRRMRQYRVAEARERVGKALSSYQDRKARKSLVAARGMLRCGDRALSVVRGAVATGATPGLLRGLRWRVVAGQKKAREG